VTIGEKIADLLKAKGMPASELAKLTGMANSTLSDIMNGRTPNPTVNTIKKIADVLGISPAYLFAEGTIGPMEILGHLPPELREFVMASGNMPWIKLTKEAAEKGLTPAQLDHLISVLAAELEKVKNES
jgi:transcriptional regulator with XRE-family HTH domain